MGSLIRRHSNTKHTSIILLHRNNSLRKILFAMNKAILFTIALALGYVVTSEASPISVAGSKRCEWFGNSACKYSCVILGHDSGACDQNEVCQCSEKEHSFLTDVKDWIKDNVNVETIKENLVSSYATIKETVKDIGQEVRELVPSKCKIGPSFCDKACRAIGRVDGTCNADNTDCTCNKKMVTPMQYALCVDDGVCAMDCQRKGQASGICRKSGGWDCECETNKGETNREGSGNREGVPRLQ